MDTVFDHFKNTPYIFLKIGRGGVYGNVIQASYEATGVFKLRSGMVMTNNQESRQSDATLHIKPDESFIAQITENGRTNFVGNGVRVEGQDYEIIGSTGGDDLENAVREHYRVTLQIADYSDFAESS